MARRAAARVWLATTCGALLVAVGSAGVSIALFPAPPVSRQTTDIAMLPRVDGSAQWRVKPIEPAAMRLFFTGGKTARADSDEAGGEMTQDSGMHVELASLSQTDATETGATGSEVQPLDRAARIGALPGLGQSATRARELACLAEVIYHEARGEPVKAAIATGQTVINRALSGAYPPSLCAVVQQRRGSDGNCQYAFVCDGFTGLAKEPADWKLAQELAEKLIAGEVWLPELGPATHLHPIAEHPAWADHLTRVKRIGGLVFYRGDFSPAAVARN